jgi:hypothetical protein
MAINSVMMPLLSSWSGPTRPLECLLLLRWRNRSSAWIRRLFLEPVLTASVHFPALGPQLPPLPQRVKVWPDQQRHPFLDILALVATERIFAIWED